MNKFKAGDKVLLNGPKKLTGAYDRSLPDSEDPTWFSPHMDGFRGHEHTIHSKSTQKENCYHTVEAGGFWTFHAQWFESGEARLQERRDREEAEYYEALYLEII